MIKFKYLILIPVLAALLAGCGAGKDHKVIEMAPVSVEVGVAKSTADYKRIQVSGRIEAVSSANVSTRMMGNVSKVLVKPGDHVNKGDLLLQISGADLKAKEAQVDAAIVQAKSGLENARNDYERFQTLYEKGSASKKEFENMTTRFEVAKAGLEAAEQMKNEVEAQFAYTNLRAPFTGVITNTFVKAGDIANPGMPLATVEGIKEYQAAVMVPESQISKVQAGAKVSVLVKSKNRSVDG
ncbi:MAG: efflux RND transporter periplasmic adaptor subunit, partial [Ekhidna sp.]|nr:efflux RND transporter periplasmic adaptor subunit [Ekhidna sp.]